MYKVYLDETLIYDLSLEITLFEPVIELEDNKPGSFDFEIAPDNPGYNLIKKMKSIISVYKMENLKEVEIFKGRVIEEEKDFYNIKQVSCEGELAFLLDSIQRPARYQNIGVRELLKEWIEIHNQQVKDDDGLKTFQLGIVTVSDPDDSLYRYTNWENTFECIKDKFLDRLGGHIRIRNQNGIRFLDYIKDYENTNTQSIEFGENLLDYTENISAGEITTCCIPLGAKLDESPFEALDAYTTITEGNNGKDYVCIPEAVKKYGWIVKTVEFEDVRTSSALIKKGMEWLQDKQYEILSLTLTAIDLNLYDVNFERIKLGDRIRANSDIHGMDRFFSVVKLTTHLDEPEQNTVQLGDTQKNLTERNVATTSNIYAALSKVPQKTAIIKEATANMEAIITAATTGYVVMRPNEILVMDIDNIETAKKIWRWSKNGLEYSNNGYIGGFENVFDINGQINGAYILPGSISSEKLDDTYRISVENQIHVVDENAKAEVTKINKSIIEIKNRLEALEAKTVG